MHNYEIMKEHTCIYIGLSVITLAWLLEHNIHNYIQYHIIGIKVNLQYN